MFRSPLLFPTVTVAVGAAMLAIPWALPLGRGPEGTLVFVVAGIVELVLGMSLAYLVLHGRSDGA